MKRGKLLLFLTVAGPGLISALAGNDAGGIITYSVAGARFGFSLLWLLFFVTFSFVVVQEMCVRMGVVTGKGLGDLIREEFGPGWTLLAMGILLLANMTTTVSEFAGIAGSLEIFGISRFFSVPIIMVILWMMLVRGTYRSVERAFLIMSGAYVSYIVTVFLIHPPWGEIAKMTLVPQIIENREFFKVGIALVGTTVTPWMQFLVQAMVVDKAVTLKEYPLQKWETITGALLANLVAFFIIVCTGATLHSRNVSIVLPQDAAVALQPLAGQFAELLFAVGLFGASMLSASVVPLTTAYVVCEAFGWERSVSRSLREAPVFFGLYLLLLLVGGVTVLFTRFSLVDLMFLSQFLNGVLLPILLIFMLKLVNSRRIMGQYANSPLYNVIVSVTVVAQIAAVLFTLLLPR